MILDSVFLCQSLSFSLCQGIGLLTLWEPNSGNKKRWGYWFNWLTPDNHQIKIFTIMTLKNIPPCNKDHSQIKSSQFLFSLDWTFCFLESNILCRLRTGNSYNRVFYTLMKVLLYTVNLVFYTLWFCLGCLCSCYCTLLKKDKIKIMYNNPCV